MQQEIKVLNGQTIFDICLIAYKDATKVYQLISENPIITDIEMDLTGLTLVYTPPIYFVYEAKQNNLKLNNLVTIKKEQSIFDLSLQYYGSLENIYSLIQENDFIENINSNNLNGNVLKINGDKNYINQYFKKFNINIGTDIMLETIEPTFSYLLQENGNYLLQENGFKIIL